jgi:hypothetical protein
MKQKSGSEYEVSGVMLLKSNSGVARHSGVDGQLEVLIELGEESRTRGSGRILNFPNSLPSGDGRCLEALIKGVPSGFLFRVRPGFPCFLETP